MHRRRSGSVRKRKDGSWWARVTYVDPVTRLRRERRRKVKTKAEGQIVVEELLREIDETDARSLNHLQSTFADLADHYGATYLREAEYVDDRKVGGYRSVADLTRRLNVLRRHFGHRPLRTITYGDLRSFRSDRLRTPVKVFDKLRAMSLLGADLTLGELSRLRWSDVNFKKSRVVVVARGNKARTIDIPSTVREQLFALRERAAEGEELVFRVGRQRSIAAVNRELALLRRLFNVALREGWITRNPFSAGESLISPADERQRERILSRDEEAKLLAACSGDRRAHLRGIIVCALDTGMRRGEILSLRWSDVDLDALTIRVRAMNTKTLRDREVPITDRLANELRSLRDGAAAHDRVFGVIDNVKFSFTAARQQAGLPDVRFHDLRHTAATRLVQGHLPLAEVGRVLGHTQPKTTYRYVNADSSTAQRAAAILNAFTAREEETSASVN